MKKPTIVTCIFVLMIYLCGCGKTTPQVSAELHSPTAEESGTLAVQTQEVPSPEQTHVTNVSSSPSIEITFFNESGNSAEALLCLGMTRENVVTVLKENNIGYGTQDDECIDFNVPHVGYILMFNEKNKTLDSVEIRRVKSVIGNPTENVLYIGDSFDKMVNLYGNTYTASSTEDYQIYSYKQSDYYFEVWFQSDLISLLRITK